MKGKDLVDHAFSIGYTRCQAYGTYIEKDNLELEDGYYLVPPGTLRMEGDETYLCSGKWEPAGAEGVVQPTGCYVRRNSDIIILPADKIQ